MVCFFLTGCASFYAKQYPGYSYAPTIAKYIPIYDNYPSGEYMIIGEVGSEGAPASRWAGMGKRMKEYAAQMGGEAVVISSVATPYVGTYTTPGTMTSNTTGTAQTNLRGTANIYGDQVNYRGSGNTTYSSNTVSTYTPSTSTPMYGKRVKAFIIKFGNKQQRSKDTKAALAPNLSFLNKGASKQEVIKKLGKPDSKDGKNSAQYWNYNNICLINFNGNKVASWIKFD